MVGFRVHENPPKIEDCPRPSRRRALRLIGLAGTGPGWLLDLLDNATHSPSCGPDHREPITFATVSDGHWGAENRNYRSKHEAVLAGLEEIEPELVVHSGDIVDSDLHPESSVEALRDVRTSFFAPLEVPYTVAHGNHDAVTENEWADTFGVSFDHTFEHARLGFIVLNSANDEREETAPDTDFLRTALEQFSEKEHVFVVSHYWFNEGLAAEVRGAGYAVEFSEEAVALVHGQENVTAVIHGHNHGPTHHDINYLSYDGTELPYVMTGVFGGYEGGRTVWGYRHWRVESDGTVETEFIDLDGKTVSTHEL